MKIPQFNLDGLGGEYIQTSEVEKFIGDAYDSHAIVCSSGTSALTMAILSLPNVESVAVPALSMVATANAVKLAGKKLVFYDQEEYPKSVDAIIHVSLNGRGCGIEDAVKFCKKHGIYLIEDACQSFGSEVNKQLLGTFGTVGCFSFSPHKIVSAGNGGCVITKDPKIAESLRRLKNFGRVSGGDDIHEYIGYNFKFTDIQAEFLLPQLEELEYRIEKKKRTYAKYYAKLHDIMIPHDGTPWMVDVYTDARDALHAYLKSQGIGTRKMYPTIPSQPCYSKTIGYPKFEAVSRMGLWLPSSLDISDAEIEVVCNKILNYI